MTTSTLTRVNEYNRICRSVLNPLLLICLLAKASIERIVNTHTMTKIVREAPNSFDLPYRIKRLADLAHNLWWVSNPEAARMFKEIDPLSWEQSNHNPVVFLRKVERRTFDDLIKDRYFLERYDRIMREFDAYMNKDDTWFRVTYPNLTDEQIAYFSFEYGLHESLMVYAGGLGVLSGDHLKEASDLGLPLVAVGFL